MFKELRVRHSLSRFLYNLRKKPMIIPCVEVRLVFSFATMGFGRSKADCLDMLAWHLDKLEPYILLSAVRLDVLFTSEEEEPSNFQSWDL